MKSATQKTIAIVILLFASISFLQAQQIDALISKISNEDVYVVLTKNMSPRILGEEAKALVTMGKPATPNLINVLEDQKKGIAAHFILSSIWKETWTEAICCNVEYTEDKEVITLNGLEIYIENGQMHATSQSLKNQKKVWKNIAKV